MKKRLRLTQCLFVASLLSSCGGGNPSGTDEEFKPSLDAQTQCFIKVDGDYSNFEALEAEFDRFKEYYPNVHLSYVKIDGSISDVLNGEEAPNIFFCHPKMIGNEQYASVVSHMEDLSNPALKMNLDCIRPNLLKRDSEGKVFMVPVFSRTYGTIINKDLFNKEGIKIPNNWNELVSVCESFVEKGYKSPMMGYTNYDLDSKKERTKVSNGFQNTVAYPLFVAELAKNPDALALANKLDPSAGQYMRGALQKIRDLIDNGCVSLEECDKLEDNYDKVLLRFLDGDIPMMVCNGDTVSGIKKREQKSDTFNPDKEAYAPFKYEFYPIPLTEQGGYFIDSPSVQFAVNKDCENLDMTNEFMRFLLRTKELDNLASLKGLICSTKTTPFAPIYDPFKKVYDPVYAPFNNVASDRRISPEVIGIKDELATQIRIASFYVGRGELTVDEAVAKYGQFK